MFAFVVDITWNSDTQYLIELRMSEFVSSSYTLTDPVQKIAALITTLVIEAKCQNKLTINIKPSHL